MDIAKNLQDLSEFPELYRDDVRETYRNESMNELFKDQDAETIQRLLSEDSEVWEFMTSYVVDANIPTFKKILAELFKKKPDLLEVGRLLQVAFNNSENDYLSLHRS